MSLSRLPVVVGLAAGLLMGCAGGHSTPQAYDHIAEENGDAHRNGHGTDRREKIQTAVSQVFGKKKD